MKTTAPTLPFSSIHIPNQAAGHFELAWDPNDEEKVAQAATLVSSLLHDGYMLMKEVRPGEWKRVDFFDARYAKIGLAATAAELEALTGSSSDSVTALPPTARGTDPLLPRE